MSPAPSRTCCGRLSLPDANAWMMLASWSVFYACLLSFHTPDKRKRDLELHTIWMPQFGAYYFDYGTCKACNSSEMTQFIWYEWYLRSIKIIEGGLTWRGISSHWTLTFWFNYCYESNKKRTWITLFYLNLILPSIFTRVYGQNLSALELKVPELISYDELLL